MSVALFALALIAAPAAQAQEAPADSPPPQRIRNVLLQPGESCPAPQSAEEVVVCGRIDNPYRIPKQFRDAPKKGPESTAWGVKVDRVMEDNRRVLPNSCSPIGSNGQTGCNQKLLEQWAAERREQLNAARPTGADEPE